MTLIGELISEAVREANAPGDILEPTQLLTLLAGTDNPAGSLSHIDRANEVFEALHVELPFIRNIRWTGIRPSPSEMGKWAALLRWLVRELRQWRGSDDVRLAKLVALFVAAQVSDWDHQLWEQLPGDIADNTELCGVLKRLISSFAVEFKSPSGIQVPIWECEAADRFKLDDAQGNWVEIGRQWSLFEHLAHPNTLQRQAVRCLLRCGSDHLVEALASLSQTFVAMQVANVLTVGQRLKLAAASENSYVQFACVYETLLGREKLSSLSVEEQGLLTDVLAKVASDIAVWRGWMQTFNARPAWCTALQAPLGRAMANASDSAFEAYIASIPLFPMQVTVDPDRRQVAECLRAFRAVATPERRRALWKCAHDRWQAWRFNQSNPAGHLLGVNWSKLDYAVVGFAVECMDDTARTTVMRALCEEMQNLEDKWHPSITDFKAAWFRLLSQFQPYAHSVKVCEDAEEWLTETRAYSFFDPTKEKYLAMKYGALLAGARSG